MDIKPFKKKIYLSSPTMHGEELKFMTEAYNTNWMSTVGKNIDEKECLGIFNFSSKSTNRIVGEQVFKTDLIDYPIIGFQNRESTNDIKENYLFEVIKGTGNDETTNVEGIHINNFFGTYLIGPLLIRNPYFKDELLKYLGISKFDETLPDYKAYYEYLKNFNIKTSSK